MSIVANNILIDGGTTPSSTLLSISGGMGVSGNINHSGKITGQSISSTASSISATNFASAIDGANTGTIDQVSTELTLNGNSKVALASGNSLVFKNDSSRQLTAFTGIHQIDPVNIHGFLANRTIIKQTYSLQNSNSGLIGVGGGNILFYNLGTLRKGQVIKGVFFWVDVAKANGSHFGLYTQTNPTLVASTASNIPIVAGMNYIDFSSTYTIPTTQVYFIGALIPTGVQGVTLNSNTYHNYGFGATTGALTANTQYSNPIYSTLPSSLSGIGMSTSLFNVFIGIYG